MDDVEAVLRRLERDGYAVVDGLLEREETARIRAELSALLASIPTGRNAFEGYRTRRIYAIFAKTRSMDALATHPLVLGVLDRVLGHYQLSAPTGIEIGPGEVAQVLHRDQDIYPLPDPPGELVTNVMWAFDDFSEANGATRLVPRCDGRPLRERPGDATPVRCAEMPAGSVLFYLGSTWHGGGANRTERPRLGVAIEYAVSWLRPQETHLLAVPPAIARGLPGRLQELLGYDVRPPFLGYVDGRHPKRLLY